jgi:hypothetical protein
VTAVIIRRLLLATAAYRAPCLAFQVKGGGLVHTDIPTRADLEHLLSVRDAACVSI